MRALKEPGAESGAVVKKNVVKWILIGIPIAAVLGISGIVLSSWVEHRTRSAQELEAYPAPGALVELEESGSTLHVYSEGAGDVTLVFLSGFGTSSPVYDFQPLSSRLSDEYRIAVVERAGYGWSSETESPRDLDTVLAETREALARAGETPPYILFPHSMAGLEAIYWASSYPDELLAVIGLDVLIPAYYEQTGEDPSLSPVITFLARSGLMRNQPGVCEHNMPVIIHGHLNEKETEIACTIFFRRTHTRNMQEEADMLSENAALASQQGPIEVPFHTFIAKEGEELWKQKLSAFSEQTGGDSVIIDGGHYIHLYDPDGISEKSRALISRLERQ